MLYCSTDPARRRREKFWGFRTLFERFPKENQRFEGIILKMLASGGPFLKARGREPAQSSGFPNSGLGYTSLNSWE